MHTALPDTAHSYDQRAKDETRQRDRLTRTLRLLRRLQEALQAGDPVPPLGEVLQMTGLPHPGVEDLSLAVPRLVELAEAERVTLNRRLKLTRELRGVASQPELAPPGLAPPPPNFAPPPSFATPPSFAPPAALAFAPTPAPSPLQSEASRLAQISARDLDSLPYGAILLDHTGRIVAYNDTESRMARLPVEAVLGRNFFSEVAPCTRVREFQGRFQTLASGAGAPVVTFDFVFPFPFGTQRVAVMLTRGAAPGTVIMALLRR